MRTSYSALDTFKTCPQKYKFQYIDNIKSPKRVEQVFGTVVHSALKYMFERGPLYPTPDEIINFYTEKWNTAAEKIHWKNPDLKEKEEKMYFEEGLKIIQNFYKKNNPWNFNAVELESHFNVEIENNANPDEPHTLTGILDRLDKNPETDEYEIIDYKTGKKMPSQAMLEDNLQLGVYSLAISDRWKQVAPENITASLYFLKHNDKVSINISREKLEQVKKRILTIITEIEKRLESQEFEPTPGPLCDWCEFKKICPMFSHEYKVGKEETPTEKEAALAVQEFLEIKEQEEKNKKRIAELRNTILTFMEEEKIGRVFGEKGYITKTEIPRTKFNLLKRISGLHIEEELTKSGVAINVYGENYAPIGVIVARNVTNWSPANKNVVQLETEPELSGLMWPRIQK